jgi:hypothetical protein
MYRLTPSMGTGSKQREELLMGDSINDNPEEARRWLALAELCGEPRAVAASVGGLFSNSIIISTGLYQFEFLQPIPIRGLRIPAHRGTHM